MRSDPRSRDTVVPYAWGDACLGWPLTNGDGLTVISEHMPAGVPETTHLHQKTAQVFYVLSGTLIVTTDRGACPIAAGQALAIAPDMPHRAENTSDAPVDFLVISW